MPNLIPLHILADAGAVVGLLVLIFTVVGWLVNLANSQNNPPAPPPNRPRPPRPKGEKIQNEIDIFLKEVRGQQVPQQDVVLEAPPPEPVRPRPRSVPPVTSPTPVAEPRPAATRGRLGSVMPQVESHVGESLASHHLASNVGETQPAIALANTRTVGEMVALPALGTRPPQKAAPFVDLVRDKRGIRQAILLTEILSKPKALRDE